MSADLFAEFNNPPPTSFTSTQPNRPDGNQHKPQAQNPPTLVDAFNFTTAQEASSTSKLVPAWSSFPSSSSGMSGWPQNFLQAQPAANSPKPAGVVVDDDDDDDDDDGWGDFEAPDDTVTPAALPAASCQSLGPIPTTPRWEPNSSVLGTRSRQPETERKARIKARPSDPNVLFDADDFELYNEGDDDEDLDDFGEFEGAEPPIDRKAEPIVASSSSSAFDLLGLDDPPVHFGKESVTNEKSHASRNPSNWEPIYTATTSPHITQASSHPNQLPPPIAFHKNTTTAEPDLASKVPGTVTTAKKNNLSTTTNSFKAVTEDDEWATWDDFSGANGGSSTTAPDKTAVPIHADQKWDWDEEEESCFASFKVDNNSPPPVNVPPPAILLSLFPELFSSMDLLFKPLSGQSITIKQQVLANPKAVHFLQGYVLIASTAARIIAGRKHRWHRDKILAKSMSISAAGSKGMKLAGVDKTQSVREDREAADVVAAWKGYVGRLRSAVAAANSALKADMKVPELTESPQIQKAKMVPTAPKPCVICGLKRDERVARVDHDVEDSFGEWWVDHWGHRACKNFWTQHEKKLRQR
ncbi:hypothetical protein E4U42_007805 [Claviceps africana]|uniref:Serine/threonine-protein kinase ppk6 n=1 Tax=Claviceps africana TaxID=83212 RepID=A0A8K0NFZ2_9HYPO|nr:hypothetical protein E4U42_007805 [Claviceps africana]